MSIRKVGPTLTALILSCCLQLDAMAPLKCRIELMGTPPTEVPVLERLRQATRIPVVDDLALDWGATRLAVGFSHQSIALVNSNDLNPFWFRTYSSLPALRTEPRIGLVRFAESGRHLIRSEGGIPWALSTLDLNSGDEVSTHHGDANEALLTASDSAALFLTANQTSQTFKLWRLNPTQLTPLQPQLVWEWRAPEPFKLSQTVASFSPDRGLVAVSVAVAPLLKSRPKVWVFPTTEQPSTAQVAYDFPRPPQAMAIRRQGDWMAVGSSRKNLYLLDLTPQHREIISLDATLPDNEYFSEVNCVAFSPSGKLLAVGTNRGRVILYDVETAKVVSNPVYKIKVYADNGVGGLKFSPLEDHLFVGDKQGGVRRYPLSLLLH